MRYALVLFVALACSGCAAFKPALRTANDVAADLCRLFATQQAQKQGISPEQAFALFCGTDELLKPWLDEVLSAEREGTSALGAAKCE